MSNPDAIADRLSVRAANSGFTLPEALISTTLFLLLLGGIVGANLFGMRMFQLTTTKLKTGDGARKALTTLTDEVRKCRSIWVGDITNGSFAGLLDGETQAGTALLIQPTTNAADFILYFLNASDQSFRRYAAATAQTTILAGTVTNRPIFSAQDGFGNILTNTQDNRVIHVKLEFFEPQAWLPVGDYAELETSVTRRRIN